MVAGEICLETAARLLEQGNELIETQAELVFNLDSVGYVDSSALALLVGWCRYAKQLDKPIRFTHVPEALMDMAKAFNLNELLPLSS